MGAPLLALNPDTGLVHLGAREYDPETGAFTRRELSGLEGGENQYAYAGGDPVNYWDPDGNFVAAVVVGAAAGAAIGGAEGAVVGAADEVLDQAFDPGRTGFDCAAIRSAAGRGAAAGAAAGAVAGGVGAKVEKTRSGKRVGDYTPSQKARAKAENASRNGGSMLCDGCGRGLENVASEKGVPTPPNQAQVHHDPPLSQGGSRNSTPRVYCPECHRANHR